MPKIQYLRCTNIISVIYKEYYFHTYGYGLKAPGGCKTEVFCYSI